MCQIAYTFTVVMHERFSYYMYIYRPMKNKTQEFNVVSQQFIAMYDWLSDMLVYTTSGFLNG